MTLKFIGGIADKNSREFRIVPKSNILKILRLFSLEEMLKLVQGVRINHVALKKAAGEELISSESEFKKPKKEPKKELSEAKVLPFPKTKTPLPPIEKVDPPPEIKTDAPQFYSTEDELWQRELAKDSFNPIHRLDAIKGYRQATDVFLVKTSDPDGKEKVRFAATNGVLVNKKQD